MSVSPLPLAPWASSRARARFDELEATYRDLSPDAVPATVAGASARHVARYDDEGLVFYAGTNAMSPAVLAALEPRLASRPSMGYPDDKYQYGLAELDHLEVAAMVMVARAFRAAFAEVRFPSATLANLAVYTAFTKPGDTIATLAGSAGGHTSHHLEGVAGVRGLDVVELPYDGEALDVDLDQLPWFLELHKPRLLVVGASLLLFPHRLRAIRAAADEVGAYVLYDASHMAGLIAGGEFQQPLEDGAHLMSFSTYKSFGGPPGGCVVTNDEELGERVATAAYPGLTANYDASRLAPLAVAAAESLVFGRDYARACIVNARALARSLTEGNVEVLGATRGWTASHHVAAQVAVPLDGDAAARRLAAANIYVSVVPRSPRPDLLRLGTQEATRRGMDEEAMTNAAELITRTLAGKAAETREEVAALRRKYSEYAYCFPVDRETRGDD